jgi:hypothetical protein
MIGVVSRWIVLGMLLGSYGAIFRRVQIALRLPMIGIIPRARLYCAMLGMRRRGGCGGLSEIATPSGR